jgi:hypothetical protein
MLGTVHFIIVDLLLSLSTAETEVLVPPNSIARSEASSSGERLVISIIMGVRPYVCSELGLTLMMCGRAELRNVQVKEKLLSTQAWLLHGAAEKENVPCMLACTMTLITVISALVSTMLLKTMELEFESDGVRTTSLYESLLMLGG